MQRRAWATAAWGLVVLACGVAIGVIVMFLLLKPAIPPSVAESSQPDAVTVSPQSFTDTRDVAVTITEGSTVPLRVSRGGVLTSITCAESEPWRSGSSSLSIDGAPIVSLHTSVPLWRSISPGTQGADVASLKAELNRLGLSSTEGDTLRWRDLVSARELFKGAGAMSNFDAVDPSSVVWLPTSEVTLGSCDASLGGLIAANDQVAETSPAVDVQIQAPTDLREGRRLLMIDQVKIDLTDQLVPQDPSSLTPILRTTSYRNASGENPAQGQPVTLEGSVSLVEPTEAVPLPPSSITMATAPAGCVATPGGDVHRVTVVSSELGQTVVIFDDGTLPAKVSAAGPKKCK